MSEDMPSSWRYLASAGSRISSLKDYVTSRDGGSGWRSPRATTPGEERQGWRAWAGQKIRVRRGGGYDANNGNAELVNVFPGWAARRYAAEITAEAPRPFEVEVFVSGFAITRRSPENASRSQRAFIRLAKGFAALPKLVESAADIEPNSTSLGHLTPSTEELLAQVNLPPRPTEITEDFDVDALDRQLKRAKATDLDDADADSLSESSSSSRSSTYDFPVPDTSASHTPNHRSRPHTPQILEAGPMPIEVLRRLHANLEQRLQPFWSSVLPNRTVRLHLFASPHESHNRDETVTPATFSMSPEEDLPIDSEDGPLASQDVVTAADGSFQVKFKVKWEDLCRHPRALHIAFGEPIEEHELLIVAQLRPPSGPPNSGSSSRSGHLSTSASGSTPQGQHKYQTQDPAEHSQKPSLSKPAPLASLTRIPITHSPIRVISDIDDTVKLSGVLAGARAVFHNVFVKDLADNVIPGMGEWYMSMWSRGVRFHYVSNGPFEYLPVLNDFIQISRLPPGSIKLRSYAGRSLFNGLLTAPAARKRAGVVDVLDSFPDSQFFLIGDTGEQDLELYADLARERPRQILGAFLRDADASTFNGPEPLDDPTGWKAIGAAGTRPNTRPLVPRSDTASSSASSLSFLKYNYGSKANVPRTPNVRTPDVDRTPRPNRYTSDGVRSKLGGRQVPKPANSFDEIAHAKAREHERTYFGLGPLNSEPESSEASVPDARVGEIEDTVLTPTLASSSRMETSKTITGQMNNLTLRSSTDPPQTPISYVTQPPKPTPPPSITQPYPHNLEPSSSSFRSQQTGSSTSSESASSRRGSMTETEKKRTELQLRVYRARTQMPSHIPLRVFRDPSECIEVQEILDQDGWIGFGGSQTTS